VLKCVLYSQYICNKSGWQENSEQWTQCRELFVELWRNLQDTADGDEDGQVTVDEWVSTSQSQAPASASARSQLGHTHIMAALRTA